MKVNIIRHSIRNRGGDRLILDYCIHLVQNGHKIVYWTNEQASDFGIDNRIEIKKIPFSGVWGTIFFTITKKFDTDIVLVDLAVMALFASFFNRRKVVYLAQDDDRTYYTSQFLQIVIGTVYWVILKILQIPIITVSEYLKTSLSKIAHGEIIAVSNGIDHDMFYRADNSPHLLAKKATYTIVLYARSDFRKGLDIGIKAIEELGRLRGATDWELWLIGSDSALINIHNLKIKRWGFLKESDLRLVLSAADIYLSPTRHEGFGLMQLEAIACGCVMITTNGFPLVTDEINALVCKINDWKSLAVNLNRVINDPQLVVKLRQNGYLLSKKYSIENSCKQFEHTLTKLAKQPATHLTT